MAKARTKSTKKAGETGDADSTPTARGSGRSGATRPKRARGDSNGGNSGAHAAGGNGSRPAGRQPIKPTRPPNALRATGLSTTPSDSALTPTATKRYDTSGAANTTGHGVLPPWSRQIEVRGAREHNLRNIDIDLPREKLVVITGLSGSGKSTLAFDTIYAEGQRRYVESLSTYARQFLEQLQKPDVESINGLPPTIAVEQRTGHANPRSTVATATEIYDFLRLMYARVGKPHCPKCGAVVERQTTTQMVDDLYSLPENTRVIVLAPVVRNEPGDHKDTLTRLRREGWVRLRVDGDVVDLGQLGQLSDAEPHTIEVVVDRLIIRPDGRGRLVDSVETAARVGEGKVIAAVQVPPPAKSVKEVTADDEANLDAAELGKKRARARVAAMVSAQRNVDEAIMPDDALIDAPTRNTADDDGAAGNDDEDTPLATRRVRMTVGLDRHGAWEDRVYSEQYACAACDLYFEPLTPRSFSFNSPHGACETCSGLGTVLDLDVSLVVPDPKVPLEDGPIDPWRKSGRQLATYYKKRLRLFARRLEIDMATPVGDLTADQQRILLYGIQTAADRKRFGKANWEGVLPNLQRRYHETDSDQTRSRLHQYMLDKPCPACNGQRLKPFSLAVTVGDKTIAEVTAMSVKSALELFNGLRFGRERATIAKPILKEVRSRLRFLADVGLSYLTLNRQASSLSGGEWQRIRLATQVGSSLVGVCYVLDEPSIGLHQRDNDRLLSTLRHLRDIGNTVLVVEHDADTIRAADYVVDLGPGAGADGGRVVFAGTVDRLLKDSRSVTGQYLSGKREIQIPHERRAPRKNEKLTVVGARAHNLKSVRVEFPLGLFTCVTGVSGSGKSTLVHEVLHKALAKILYKAKAIPGPYEALLGTSHVDKVIEIDQSPIGRTPRSNPATYTNLYGEIRDIFAQTKEARMRGYTGSRFSFNVKGGRCEACQGQGIKKIEMHFLSDIYVTCDACRGTRFNRETLEILYKGKTIAEVLDMTVTEAAVFFHNFPKLKRMLGTLDDVGLGYVKLGQPGNTLSGGEAQRVKLAAELGRADTGHTVYILDEPTTGLHFADVARLLDVLHRLVERGNTVIVIEHNLDLIKTADWIIDLGPEGGDEGGTVIHAGPPESLIENEASHTGRYLARYITGSASG